MPEFALKTQLKHVFFDQRNTGVAENEIAAVFNGPRTGPFSFIANTGTGGAAEYITSEALAAGCLTTRQPQQIFEEMLAQVASFEPESLDEMARAEADLAIDFSNDLAYAIGNEFAFTIESFSTSGPAWTLAVMVNDSAVLEDSIGRIVEAVNTAQANAGEAKNIAFSSEDMNGRTWSTLQPDWQPFGVTWTYDRGYMVASSDRATALRAIATRDGGYPLIWSSEFQQAFPTSAGMHPSGFAWINASDAVQDISPFIENPALRELIAERDPILVVLDGETEQIRAVSRTRLSSILLDALLFQGAGISDTVQQN
ncbi:MAG: hypothetical protein P8Z37_19350 [Acidobacteriota bacterium]